ncbi:MAG TPA: efflux RND transporter periplasmic adaptor subunit [Rhodanobacteraceae bacterium]
MNSLLRAGALLLPFALMACSGHPAAGAAPAATQVDTVMPARQTFHTRVAAFGQLAADHRNALSLSLPQAVEILAVDVLPGRRVKRGAVLVKYASNPATRSAYLQAQSAVNVAREDLAQAQRLHAEKLATNVQVDAARKALADARAALAAQAQLGGAHATAVLSAPANGVVTTVAVQGGQHVAAGTTLVQFSPETALAAQLAVEPRTAADIHSGMPVTIQPVYAASGSRPLRGTITMVGKAVNPSTHLVDLVATLDKPARLAAGTALSADIDTANFPAWSIPRNALQTEAHGDYVYQIEHGKAKRVNVKVVAPGGSPIGVEGAIDPHAPIITLGSYEVSDGETVRASDAAKTPAKEASAR